MRRRLVKALPALAHWFGLKPTDVADLTPAELDRFLAALKDLPPPGWVFAGQPKGR